MSDNFPLKTCGILGAEFLRQNSASLQFDTNGLPLQLPSSEISPPCRIVLPARSRKLVSLTIDKLNNLSEGYLERINAEKEVILGESLVRAVNSHVKVFAINTTLHDLEVSLPPVKLQEVEIFIPNKKVQKNISKNTANRMNKLLKLFNFSNLNEEEKNSLLDPITRFAHRFYVEGDVLEATDLVTHTIKTTDDTPIFQRQHRPAETLSKEISKQTKDLKKNEIIDDSDSPYNSPVWIVPKKPGPDGQKRWRMVIDFRRLNDITIEDSYPLPNITSILDKLGGAQYFSTLDLAMGFHQIKMHPDLKSKTAFSTPFWPLPFQQNAFRFKKFSVHLPTSC